MPYCPRCKMTLTEAQARSHADRHRAEDQAAAAANRARAAANLAAYRADRARRHATLLTGAPQ